MPNPYSAFMPTFTLYPDHSMTDSKVVKLTFWERFFAPLFPWPTDWAVFWENYKPEIETKVIQVPSPKIFQLSGRLVGHPETLDRMVEALKKA